MDTTEGSGLTDKKGCGRKFRSDELAIRWDERLSDATCGACGRDFEAGGGPNLYVAEGWRVLCPKCGQDSASSLFYMVREYRDNTLRYSTLESFARHCCRIGIHRDDMDRVIEAVNRAMGDPPLSADDLQPFYYDLANKPPRRDLDDYVARLRSWFEPLVEAQAEARAEAEDLPF